MKENRPWILGLLEVVRDKNYKNYNFYILRITRDSEIYFGFCAVESTNLELFLKIRRRKRR